MARDGNTFTSDVLGAAEYRGRPSPVLKARLDHALDLYSRHLAPRIITTGGAGGDPVYTEDDLDYAPGGSGDASVWEVAIPWSQVTGLRGFAGKEMAIGFDVGGDLLFETDHAARIRLVG